MSSVTDAELNAAAQKLIEEANAESAAALAEYERSPPVSACWRGELTVRVSCRIL